VELLKIYVVWKEGFLFFFICGFETENCLYLSFLYLNFLYICLNFFFFMCQLSLAHLFFSNRWSNHTCYTVLYESVFICL